MSPSGAMHHWHTSLGERRKTPIKDRAYPKGNGPRRFEEGGRKGRQQIGWASNPPHVTTTLQRKRDPCTSVMGTKVRPDLYARQNLNQKKVH